MDLAFGTPASARKRNLMSDRYPYMKRGLATATAVVAMAFTACGGRAEAPIASPSVGQVAAPSVSTPLPSPTSASPIPTASTSSSPLGQGLVGDLPAEIGMGSEVGFVHFPSGTFAADPAATMVDDPSSNRVRTAARPYLYGTRGTFAYDRAVGRWLPVSPNQVSADGLHYAYVQTFCAAEGGGQTGPQPTSTGVRLHVVDVLSGSDQTVLTSESCAAVYEVVNYEPQGIYLTAGCPAGCPPDALKLWQWSFSAKALIEVSDQQCFGWTIHDQIAWGRTYTDPAHEYLLRLDLNTRQESNWVSTPSPLIGLDGEGFPMLASNDSVSGSELIRVTAAQQTETLARGPYGAEFLAALADGSRTWLARTDGIYLYTSVGGIQKVSDFAGIPVGTLG